MQIQHYQQRREALLNPEQAVDDEKQLMKAAARDLQHFAPIYENYFTRVYRYCLRRVSHVQEAEDLTALVFTRAMQGVGGYRGGSVAAWIFQIAHNTVVNHLRRRREAVSIDANELDFTSSEPDPLDNLLQDESHERVRQVIAATLDDEQQNLLALKLVAGLTSQEIGTAVGKSAGAVRVEIHRIMKTLRAHLEGEKTHE